MFVLCLLEWLPQLPRLLCSLSRTLLFRRVIFIGVSKEMIIYSTRHPHLAGIDMFW